MSTGGSRVWESVVLDGTAHDRRMVAVCDAGRAMSRVQVLR